MFMNDVHRKDEIKEIATSHLRKYGIKFRLKKPRNTQQEVKSTKKVFKVPLSNLQTQTVTLTEGQQLTVPKLVHEICSFILTKADVEGVFRKEGSKSRQNEIKLSLDRGCCLGEEHHVIDVAVVLKSFLRELPEPLIPYAFHELFLRCSLTEKKLDALQLACLLLPSEHLNVLAYLMQFFQEIAKYSELNKMTPYNLALLIGPNVFPLDDKLAPKSQLIMAKVCDFIKIMIENSQSIGQIPEYIIEQISNITPPRDDKRKKKRRSGSLTRMFNGLKKIVTNKSEEISDTALVTPDLLLTPSISTSMKKRKVETGLSAKKKKEVLNKVPDNVLLNTPFTPLRTPISGNPNPNKSKLPEDNFACIDGPELHKEKKGQWYRRSRSVKNLKEIDDFKNRRSSLGPKALLERRWSQVSQAANFRKKKRDSCVNQSTKKSDFKIEADDSNSSGKSVEITEIVEPDYVRVSKTEYEEIKSRVSEIERRISIELENVQYNEKEEVAMEESVEMKEEKNVDKVQTAYINTLEQIEPLSPTTDQLARRLSRDLRIRRSCEQKIIRSPSARKIGCIRRRSREFDKQNKLVRNQSWHIARAEIIPRVNLKRSKPVVKQDMEISSGSEWESNRRVTRSTSFHGSSMVSVESNSVQKVNSKVTCNTSGSSSEHWISAEGYFTNLHNSVEANNSATNRASIAMLRSQNAGMVLAKARLFDNLKDSDSSNNSEKSTNSAKLIPRVRVGSKIGAARNVDGRLSYRVKALRQEEKNMPKRCSMSPRRRPNLGQKQRLRIAKQYVEAKNKEKENDAIYENLFRTPKREPVDVNASVSGGKRTPKNVPQIKKNLGVRSPKRLGRTPTVNDKRTPLKAVLTLSNCDV